MEGWFIYDEVSVCVPFIHVTSQTIGYIHGSQYEYHATECHPLI